MSRFTEDDLKKLSQLCRIQFPKEDKDRLFNSLNKIFAYMDTLQEIDTEGVATCNHVLGETPYPLAEDLPGNHLDRREFLENAPEEFGGMIRVPTVIHFSGEA